MSKDKAKIVESIEPQTDGTVIYTFPDPTPQKSSADNMTRAVRVLIDPKKIMIPKAEGNRKRVDVRTLKDHPEQKSIRNIVAGADLALILSLIGPLAIVDVAGNRNVDDTCAPFAGQDITRDPMHVAELDSTVLRGHRRKQGIITLHQIAPTLAQLLYPDHTFAAQLHKLKALDGPALDILNDHDQRDNRKAPLFAERVNHWLDLKKKNTPTDVLHKFFPSKQVRDDIARFLALPADVVEMIQGKAARDKRDVPRNTLTKLYGTALDKAVEIGIEKKRTALAASLQKAGKSAAAARAEAVESIKPPTVPKDKSEYRELIPKTAKEVGAAFVQIVADIKEGKENEGSKPLTGPALETLASLARTASAERFPKNEKAAAYAAEYVTGLIEAIRTGKADVAALAVKVLIGIVPSSNAEAERVAAVYAGTTAKSTRAKSVVTA